MVNSLLAYFKTGPASPLLQDPVALHRLYHRKRWSIWLSLIAGYAFFYTCRLGLAVTKKPLLDEGVMTASQMGIVGSVMLYVYALGKFVNGVCSDHANIRRFMSWALFLSALINIAFGFTKCANNSCRNFIFKPFVVASLTFAHSWRAPPVNFNGKESATR